MSKTKRTWYQRLLLQPGGLPFGGLRKRRCFATSPEFRFNLKAKFSMFLMNLRLSVCMFSGEARCKATEPAGDPLISFDSIQCSGGFDVSL